MRSEEIWIYSIIGLMINVFSFYLFSLKRMDFVALIIILAGSLFLIMILGIQSKTNEIKDELENQKLEQRKLNERLKIYEQLIDMKTEIKVLQNEVFYGKKK